MPCSDNFTDEQERQKVVKALDERTDMLCRTLKKLEQLPSGIRAHLTPGDVAAWWDKHKAFDKSQGR